MNETSEKLQLRNHIACRNAIDKCMRDDYDGYHLPNLKNVFDSFNIKTIKEVLSNTVVSADWDGRYSPINRQWANKNFYSEDVRLRNQYLLSTHPALIDGIINQVRNMEV